MTADQVSGLAQLFGFYDKRGYQNRVGTGKRPAVVVIDFSNAFTANAGDFPGGDFSQEIAATLRMLKLARGKRIPVFYTTIAYDDPHTEAGLWGKKVPWLYHCKTGSPAVAIDPRLDPQTNEPVIVKRFPSALHGTDLLERLRALEIDTVLLAGCTTSVCVRATTIDMMQNGYMTLPVADAIGEFDPQLHALHLKDLNSRYGDVVSIDEALAYLSSVDENTAAPGT